MQIEIIPPRAVAKRKLKVCAYCRVSSTHDDQQTSVENQIEYYESKINSNPEYEFAGIYCDRGISGTKEERPEFQRMLKDARLGKIDLVLTKSISRFARNTDTMLKTVRELQEYGIGIFFELQNMNTLDMEGELLLTIYAAFAQAESENTSELLRMAHLRRVKNGDNSACLCGLFGYSKDADGIYKPDENARWIKRIFEMAADGYRYIDIARVLNKNGVRPMNAPKFSGTVIAKILHNPSYTGIVVRKNYYENEDGIICVNDGTHPPLIARDNHTPIISADLWRKAQKGIPLSLQQKKQLKKKITIEELQQQRLQYKGKFYCAECGYIMHGSVAKREHEVVFHCYGNGNYGKEFCKVNTIPLNGIRKFGEVAGKVYVKSEIDELGRRIFSYETEGEWNKHNIKKEPPKRERDMETAILEGRLYCRCCGSRLLRRAISHGKNIWICEGNKRKGVTFCKGIKVPDGLIKQTDFLEDRIYIWEVAKGDDQRDYYYSTETEKGRKL